MNIKLIILASNSSSSLTKVLKFLHKKNDLVFTRNGSKFIAPESNATLKLTNRYTMHDFNYGFKVLSNQPLFHLAQDQ